MKKIIALTAVLTALCFSGCAQSAEVRENGGAPAQGASDKSGGEYEEPKTLLDVTLIEDASPSTSALALYEYDGEAVQRSFLFDAEKEQEIIDYFNSLSVYEADNADIGSLTGEMYGIEIVKTDGRDLKAAWINGYWLADDGTFYSVSPDFEQIKSGYDWEDADTLPVTALPNVRYLAETDGEWNTAFLSESGELTPHGIDLEITAQDGYILTAKLTDTSGAENCFGEYYFVQAQIDGVWYNIPPATDMAFNDIAYILPANQSAEKTYDILPFYGELPAGAYRLVVEGAAAEFDVG